jgi:hypothetical protein
MQQGQYKLAFFDAMDLKTRRYLDVAEFQQLLSSLNLETVPILYHGPWKSELIEQFSNGLSTLADHVREGFVARPIVERWDDQIGRVALKFIGEDYLLRKEK